MKILLILKWLLALLWSLRPKGKKARNEAYAAKAQKKGDEIHGLDEEIRMFTTLHVFAMANDNHGMRAKLERLLAGKHAKCSRHRRKQKHLKRQAS